MRRILSAACAVVLVGAGLLLPRVPVAGERQRASAGVKPLPQRQVAQAVTRELRAAGYEVQRGYPMLYTQDDCDRYSYPVMANCYGNNPASPYVAMVVESWEDEFVDPALENAFGNTRRGFSATYRLDPREAILVIAELPPPGRYMGFQSWVFTREWLTPDAPWDAAAYAVVAARAPTLVGYLFNTVPGDPSRIQSFSTVSNNINDVVIRRQSGAAFGQTRYFIVTPDRAMDRAVRSSLADLGVRDEDVFTEPIPPRDAFGDLALGLDATADDFLTLIRYAMPDDDHAAHAWWASLPLTIVRVRERPASARPAEPFPAFLAPDERTAVPEEPYRGDLDDLVRAICDRWGQPCDPANRDPDQLRPFVDLALDLGQFGPQCRAIGMNCLGDGQDASYFVAPGRELDPAWVYAVVGTLGTVTGNATYVGLSINDLSMLKGVLNLSDTRLTGTAASYSGTVANTDKFFVHYFTRDCAAIASLTDGQCTTLTEEMVPPLGEGTQGLFSAALRAYVLPGTERGPLSSGQLRPWMIRFAQP